MSGAEMSKHIWGCPANTTPGAKCDCDGPTESGRAVAVVADLIGKNAELRRFVQRVIETSKWEKSPSMLQLGDEARELLERFEK